MPLLLPPFGRGGNGSGGGSGLPPRLQSLQQDTEASTGVNKRPVYLPHAPSGRGIRPNWNRQSPGHINGMGPRETRLDSPEAGFTGVSSTQEKEQGKQKSRDMRQSGSLVLDPDEFPALPSRKLERMSSKGSSSSSTDSEMPMPSGCPLPKGAFTAPPPLPPAQGPMHNSLAPSPFLFPPPANVSQSQVPFSPYLVVPHVDTSAPINVNVKSSSDPAGNDLPMSDIATLRFFFNLGLEYYRLCMLFQLQQQQQYAAFIGSQQIAAAAAGPVQPMDGAIYVGDLEDIQGSYTVSNALPAAPANTYMTQDPSAAAHSVVPAAAPVPTAPAPPPPAPPGGIVYYCQQQQQQQQQQPDNYTYSATTYTVPAPQGTTQYVYTAPTGYQTYDNYAYS